MRATWRICRHFFYQRPARHSLLVLGACLIAIGLMLPLTDATSTSGNENSVRMLTLNRDETPINASTPRATVTQTPATTIQQPASDAPWTQVTVRNGDNLAAVFKRAGLSAKDVHNVVNAGSKAAQLTRIFPGDHVHLQINDAQRLTGLRYRLSETQTLELTQNENGELQTEVVTVELERRIAEAQGQITSSLYNAALKAGLDDRLIMELAGIFGWDIDFALDIRRNDRFVVIYETLHRDGKKVRNGKILAAEFVNRGERFQALRYTTATGKTDYYSPDGRSMRKAFLRTPTDFSRVSSEFNPNRVHPVYGTSRPHRGTDYAAPPGTPIKAAGDGKIIHRGGKGGYGNTVILQHGTRYTTLYAHMRNFAKGQRTGDRVSQGDIIGYVGSTGLSTGPHLHYEFRVDGVHRNPRTVDLPTAEPIEAQYRTDFERSTAGALARLERLSGTRLAQASN